jgi:hypothetical protein
MPTVSKHSSKKTVIAFLVRICLGRMPTSEVINVFAIAIRSGLTAQNLRDMIFAYPTSASDVGYMI